MISDLVVVKWAFSGDERRMNLPISSSSHDQERRSFAAFQNITPSDLFIIRTEGERDYGVDLILEAKILGDRVSNFRTHVQLKTIAEGKRNNDGTLSFAISVKTLNYLRNQPNSLYAVYVENEEAFLWDWNSEIELHAARNNIEIDTTQQDTITYRFYKVLDWKALVSIHQRVVTTGSIIRRLCDLLASATPNKAISMVVDVPREEVTNADNYACFLKEYGIFLANNGDFAKIDACLEHVPSSYRRDPHFATIVAYGKFRNGEYYDAFSWFPKGGSFLRVPEDLLETAKRLDITLRHILGFVDEDGYVRAERQLEEEYPNSLITFQIKLWRQRNLVLMADRTMKEDYTRLVTEMKELVGSFDKLQHKSHVIEWYVKAVLLELDGFLLLDSFLDQSCMIQSREIIGNPIPLSRRLQAAREFLDGFNGLLNDFNTLFNSSLNDCLKASTYVSYANMQMGFLAVDRAYGNQLDEDGHNLLETIRGGLVSAINVLESYGQVLEVLRAGISLANCLYGLGNSKDADDISQRVKVTAETYGIAKYVEASMRLISGISILYTKPEIDLLTKDTGQFINLSENDIAMYARQSAEMLGLPSERVPNIIIDYKWVQEDEEDKRSYCQYLRTMQDLSHRKVPENAYSINPNRIFCCSLFGYRSSRHGTNRNELLATFKGYFCLGCKEKKPL